MWCMNCCTETNASTCPICNAKTVEDLPVEIFWCKDCNVPVIQVVSQADKGICPRCGKKMKYLSTDLRPVFPEERLLLEILIGREPNEFVDRSVWALNNRYYVDGKPIVMTNSLFQEANTDLIAKKLDAHKSENSYNTFNEIIERFIEANITRLNYIKDEAYSFVNNEAGKFPEENIVISFSGGKDSTATADVVVKSLPDGFEAKKFEDMPRIHIKYHHFGFAVIDLRQNFYHLYVLGGMFSAIGVKNYDKITNMSNKTNRITRIPYEDTEILGKLFAYVESNPSFVETYAVQS